MTNMRRILKTPTLRMADGGMFDNLRANVNRLVGNNPQAMAARGRSEDYDKPAPPAAAPKVGPGGGPVTPTNPAGLRFADGGDLRTGQGGHVPGTGHGDKIPAKYEPGEFVVSNDMLDAKPGLREHLHDLRGNVLAAKGMTPAQADAKAVGGGTLRAAGGYDGVVNTNQLNAANTAAQYAMPPMESGIDPSNPRAGVPTGLRAVVDRRPPAPHIDAPGWTTSKGAGTPSNGINFNSPPEPISATTSPGAAPTPGAAARPPGPGSMTAKQLFSQPLSVIADNPNGPMKFAQPSSVAPVPASPITNAQQVALYAAEDATGAAKAAGAAAPTLRAGMASQAGIGNKALYAGGRAVAGAAKVLGALAPVATGADAISHFNDYKINDPDVDSSAGGTWGALRKGDFAGAGRSFSKGALETGMDLGNFVANNLDYVVPGKAPVSTAYNGMLRKQFGDQLAAHADVTGQVNAAQGGTAPATQPGAPAPSQATRPSQPTDPYTRPGADATMPGQDPGRVTLRGQAGAAVPGAPGISKFVQNGKTLYSNVAGPDNDKLMSDRPGVSTVPGMSKEQIAQIMGGSGSGPDQGRTSAPIILPNTGGFGLLDKGYQDRRNAGVGGIDQSGLSQRQKAQFQIQQAGNDNQRLSVENTNRNAIDRNNTDLRGQNLTHSSTMSGQGVSMRGQDMELQARMAPIQLANLRRQIYSEAVARSRDPKSGEMNPNVAAGLMDEQGFHEEAASLRKGVTDSLSQASSSNALMNDKWKDMQDQFKGQYLNPDKNGTPEANAGLESRAFARLKRTNPDAYKLSDTKRSEAIRNAISDEELMGAFGAPQGAGYGKLVPEVVGGNRLDDRTNEIPGADKLRGATISDRTGVVRGALPFNGLSRGDYSLRTPSGRADMNLHNLSGDALARLQSHIDQSNATK